MWNYFPVQGRSRQCLIGHVFYLKSATPSVQWLTAIYDSWADVASRAHSAKPVPSWIGKDYHALTSIRWNATVIGYKEVGQSIKG